MSVAVNAESIKQFNMRLAGHKSKVERLRMQVEMQEKEVANQLQKLTEALGVPVTEENINQLYEQYRADLENQLTNGTAILDRIEGKEVNQPMQTAQPAVNNPFAQPAQATPVQQATTPQSFGFGQQVQHQAAPVQQQFPSQMGTPVQYSAPQQAAPQFPQNMGTPVGQTLNAGMPEQAPQATPSQFAGFAQTMGNFDAQQGVNMNNFGNGGVIGV